MGNWCLGGVRGRRQAGLGIGGPLLRLRQRSAGPRRNAREHAGESPNLRFRKMLYLTNNELFAESLEIGLATGSMPPAFIRPRLDAQTLVSLEPSSVLPSG